MRLRLSEEKFSRMVSVSVDAILAIDEQGRITLFNEGAERIFGWTAAEILGRELEVLVPERHRPGHRQHVLDFAEGPEISRRMSDHLGQISGLRKDGREFAADGAIAKIEVGNQKMISVTMRDVSEAKRFEDEQRILAEVGRMLVAAGSDVPRLLDDVANALVREIAEWCAIDLVKGDGLLRHRVACSDPANAPLAREFEEYAIRHEGTGPQAQVLLRMQPLMVSDATPEYLHSIAQDEEHERLIKAAGTRSFMVLPLLARGHCMGLLSVGSTRAQRYQAHDLAYLEKLASLVALAVDNARLHEELEKALHARDAVLGIVAHDLRNPLNSIVLYAKLLEHEQLPSASPNPTAGDEPRAAERIHRAAMRMNRLIQDMLDVSRLEAGNELAMHGETVTVASLLDELREHQTPPRYRAELRLPDEVMVKTVWGDRTRLLQVLDNVVGNALKFGRTKVQVDVLSSEGEATFRVRDDGPGISAADLPHVFDRFWQAKRADRRGAGLGLSIAKGIVDAHGGRIWAESETGGATTGTTFYFTVPLRPPGKHEGRSSSP